MLAMQLNEIGMALQPTVRPDPMPDAGEVRLRVEACAVCRTDVHVVDGDLSAVKLPLIPGHEIVGVVDRLGTGVDPSRLGRRVGVSWLGQTCNACAYCAAGRENLCDTPVFTGYTRDGGFATFAVARAEFAFDLDPEADPVGLAPLLCAGLIGWRALQIAGDGQRIGIYGFGAAAHIITQVAVWQGREIFAFTRPGDNEAQHFARELGASWTGGSDERPAVALDAAIIFAPVGGLIPAALAAVRKGGRVVCGGIYMSDIPAMPYALLWEERELVSVANLTRRDVASFFPIARMAGVRAHTRTYRLDEANVALADLRAGRFSGAGVLVP